MRVGIMQPYFFPYPGYFSLIKDVDLFILLDEVQFIRHGWIERNRILKPKEDWQYIKIPLKKHSRSTIIREIEISPDIDWKTKINAQFEHYRKKAAFYTTAKGLLEQTMAYDTLSITKMNLHLLKQTCKVLGINTPIQIFSELDIEIKTPTSADEWALNICKELKGDIHYINPAGGATFFDSAKYLNSGIDISFLQYNNQQYDQKRPSFESGLSILDAISFCEKDEIKKLLNSYEIVDT